MLKPLVCALFVALLVSIQANDTCPKAYSNCNLGKPGFINVHMVSHTHDDVGWLKTVDQYFYGSNSGNQEATVQYVIDSVVDELSKDPNKRFVYVEIAYFWRWWNEQNDATKQLVRTLVDQGRLEFVIGAWCMDDEANPYYTDMIDQQALGFKFILEEFGPCARPRAAWQIDPFGHSREQASLFAQFGFDGLFLGRIDYQDKDTRENTKTMEMLWQASENLGDAARLFTGILPNGYGPPPGFCFDQYCGDDPIMDDPNLDEYNVDQKVSDFLKYTHQQADAYKTSNLIMTMGSDFQYSNAHRWYKNLDKLIKYVNMEQQKGSNVNIFYSTTACYLYSLNMANTTWPLKYDDFFPYAHRPHSFWTGYFTSRSALKFNVRRTSNILQTVRQLAALADLKDPMAADAISTLERAMGVTQHHDAVAGTEKQHVANDYAKRLWIGTSKCVNVINDSYSAILTHLTPQAQLSNTSVIFCSLLNITECLPIENQNRFTLNIYNPLPRSIESWISLPVVGSGAGYTVTDLSTLKTVTLDIAPVYKEIDLVIERQSHANNRAVFKASLPAMGFSSYSISNGARSQTDEKSDDEENQSVENNNVGGFDIKNAILQMSFDDQGNLVSLVNLNNSLSTTITQTYCIYKSMPGNNSDSEFEASGAYIFRPFEQSPECLSVKGFSVFSGKQFTEVHQIFNEWISQTIRLYDGAQNAEFEWQVGPIDINDNFGREVVIRFQSDLKSNTLFYTDSNGREMLTRKRDFRPTWKLNQTEPVSGNYYPVNSRIFIRDEVSKRSAKNSNRRQLTLVNDRSQGGSSILDGSVEIMLHRRTLYDDALGVGEPLNETILNKQGMVVNGIVSLIFDSVEGSARVHRELAHRVNNRPLLTFVLPADESFNSDIYRPLAGWSALGQSTLPPNVHLLTFAKDFDTNHEFTNSLVVRLEHFYENGEDAELSKPVTLNLRDTFNATFNFVGIQELALGANMPVEELNERLTWNSSDDLDGMLNKKEVFKSRASNDFEVTLNPMQIRTFRIFYLPNH